MNTIIKTSKTMKTPLFFLLVFSLSLLAFISTGVPKAHAANASTQAMINIEQIFNQTRSSNAVGTFTYQLKALSASNPMPSGSNNDTHTFTISGSSKTSIGPLTFVAAGVYYYELKCSTSVHLPGYTCDEQIYIVSIYVRNVGNGLSAEVIPLNEVYEKAGDVVFVKGYQSNATDPKLMTDPPVRKTVSGNPSTASTFLFTLTAQDSSWPMPEGSVNGVKTVKVIGSGEEEFGTWSYTKEGTYFYTIAEVNTGESSYKYDATVYTITDVVSDVNGQLILNRTVTNSANRQVDSCSFVNQYSPSLVPDGQTKIPGKGPKTGDYTNPMHLLLIMVSGCVIAIVCACVLYADSKKNKINNENKMYEEASQQALHHVVRKS